MKSKRTFPGHIVNDSSVHVIYNNNNLSSKCTNFRNDYFHHPTNDGQNTIFFVALETMLTLNYFSKCLH